MLGERERDLEKYSEKKIVWTSRRSPILNHTIYSMSQWSVTVWPCCGQPSRFASYLTISTSTRTPTIDIAIAIAIASVVAYLWISWTLSVVSPEIPTRWGIAQLNKHHSQYHLDQNLGTAMLLPHNSPGVLANASTKTGSSCIESIWRSRYRIKSRRKRCQI